MAKKRSLWRARKLASYYEQKECELGTGSSYQSKFFRLALGFLVSLQLIFRVPDFDLFGQGWRIQGF
jgi:hypothetical protein